MRRPAAVNRFFGLAPMSRGSERCSRRSRPSQVEICRNGAEQARTRVSAAKRILAGEHRSGIPTTLDGRWSGNSFPLVSLELLKFVTILCLSIRRFALPPSALFVERSLRCQLGVLNFGLGAAVSDAN
jgi:hypothetical protein